MKSDIFKKLLKLRENDIDNNIGTLKDIVDKFAQVAINFSELIKPFSAFC
jgi:hypothetical protein